MSDKDHAIENVLNHTSNTNVGEFANCCCSINFHFADQICFHLVICIFIFCYAINLEYSNVEVSSSSSFKNKEQVINKFLFIKIIYNDHIHYHKMYPQ